MADVSPAASTTSRVTRKSTHFSVVDAVRIDAESFRDRRAYWITENPETIDCRGRATALVDSGLWEIIVTLAICADMSLTIVTFVGPPDSSWSMFLAGGLILMLLVTDVVLRIVKSRLQFFMKLLNWIEFIVVIVGLVTVIIELEERLRQSYDGIRQPGASLGRTIRPGLRAFRVFRGFVTCCASRGGIQGRLSKGVDGLLDHIGRKQLVEFLLMPEHNIKIQPSQGIFHLERAQLRSSMFGNLYLPVLLTAGIFDMVHLELKMGKLKEGHHRLMVLIENVILVLGPGRKEERASEWNFEDVKASKAKTIKLASKMLEAFAKPRKQQQAHGNHGSVRVQKQAGSSWIQRKLAKLLRDILNNGMQIVIHDLEIRYEDDSSGICGPYGIIGGFTMDSLQLRAANAGQGHGDETHRFRARGLWRSGLSASSTWRTGDAVTRSSSSRFSFRKVLNLSNGVHGGLHGHGFRVFWDVFPVESARKLSSRSTGASSQFRLHLQEDSVFSITDFLKTRKSSRTWERFRYGLCSGVVQRMLETYVSPHRLREKARRLRETIGQHKYVVEPFDFSVHFISRTSRGSGEDPHLDVDISLKELSSLLDILQLKALAALLGYLQTWTRQDALFQWRPPPAEYKSAADISGSGLSKGRLLWAYALKLVLKSIHPTYFWTTLAWMNMRRGACMREALFEAISARTVDKERVEVLQVGLPLLECLAVRREFLIEQARRRRGESRKRRWRCCARKQLDAEVVEEQEDDDEGDETESEDVAVEVIEVSPEASAEQPKERRFGLWRSQTKDKVDLSGLKDFVQVHVTLGNLWLDLLYAPHLKRRRAMLRFGADCEILWVKGAPYPLWSCLAPPMVVVTLPVGDQMHKRPALGLQVREAGAVFSAAPKDGPELRSVLVFDQSRERSAAFQPVLQLRASKLKPLPMSGGAPWRVAVCVEPFRAMICKSFVLRLRDFLVSFLTVPNLDPKALTKQGPPHARDLEDPCHLWVQLQEIRKRRHQRHKHLKFGRRLEMAMGLRGPLANSQGLFGSVIFPKGFLATILQLYHENRWMRLTLSAPPGMQEFHRLAWPVDGSGGYRAFGATEPMRSDDGWCFETAEHFRNFAAVKAAGGIPQEDARWAFTDLFEVDEPALAGPPRLASKGLPERARTSSVQQTPSLLSCAAQVAGPTAVVAATVAAEIVRSTAARLAASVPGCSEVESVRPAQPRPKAAPTVQRSRQVEAAPVSVSMEVLPKGALGLPTPWMLPRWWEELGLLREDFPIVTR